MGTMLMKIILLQKVWGTLLFYTWLQNHLIPCPFKYLTGIDCPGCGFQRAALALLQGHLNDSIQLYPPLIPIILFGCYCFADSFFKFGKSKPTLKTNLFMLVGLIVLLSYGLKMWGHYHNYITSAFAAI
jgi:hypothetical protein